MQPSLKEAICEHIGKTVGPFQAHQHEDLGGGCISKAVRLSDGDRAYFVKTNESRCLPMFQAESVGLETMAATHTLAVPETICLGVHDHQAYLVLEWLPLSRSGDWHSLGTQLAAMHRTEVGSSFGFVDDNFIGTTPQTNPEEGAWATFFLKHRLEYQLELAGSRGAQFPRITSFLKRAQEILEGREVRPSLVHGDFWSGNVAFLEDGRPVVYDPACYHGDREVDLAMSRLFGGFPQTFYEAYEQRWPLPEGAHQRRAVYNLYHLLNHYNLFGGHYEQEANRVIDDLLG